MREEQREKQNTKRNIVLVGPMGTGKSRIGRLLSDTLGWQFVDTDRYIERRYGETMAEVSARLGNDALAEIEQDVIDKVRHYHHAVIAIGGNFVMREKGMARLREHGVVVLLYARTFRIVERVERSIGKRPTMNYDDVRGCVADLNREWYELRGTADRSVNTTYRSPDRIVKEIRDYLQRSEFRFIERHRSKGAYRKGQFHGKKDGSTHQRR